MHFIYVSRVSVLSLRLRVIECILISLLISGGIITWGQGADFQLPYFNAERAHDYVELVNQGLLDSTEHRSDTTFLLAQLNSQIGNKEIAVQLGLQAHHLSPDDAEIFLFVIKLLVREDHLEEVRSLCNQLSEKLNTNSEVLIQGGMVEERLGDLDKAHEYYKRAIQLDSKNYLSQMLLGKILLKQGEPASALRRLEMACRLGNRSANPYYALSRAQLRMGDKDSASQSIKRFQRLKAIEMANADKANEERNPEVELRSVIASFHAGVGAAFIRSNQFPEGEMHLKRAIEVAPDYSKGFENLANYYIQKRRLKEARSALERLVQLVPDNAGFHLNLGTVAIQMRDAVQAKSSFEKSLKLSPDQPLVLSNLSRLYLMTGREVSKALEMCLTLVDLDGSAAHHDLLAWAYYANGRLQDAVKASTKSVKLEPDHPGYRERNQKLLQLKAPK